MSPSDMDRCMLWWCWLNRRELIVDPEFQCVFRCTICNPYDGEGHPDLCPSCSPYSNHGRPTA